MERGGDSGRVKGRGEGRAQHWTGIDTGTAGPDRWPWVAVQGRSQRRFWARVRPWVLVLCIRSIGPVRSSPHTVRSCPVRTVWYPKRSAVRPPPAACAPIGTGQDRADP